MSGVWWSEDRLGVTAQAAGDREGAFATTVADLTLDNQILKEAAQGNF